ncbi:iron chelate uptake ABC transporter family permease subunit, partial [Dickeya dianthicola]|uniref:iron chelate uptake ABC transporter family permease subunit n=1 Tax=Dickeya dianthicola TaxID=204039 RepID=UPI001E5CB931
MSYQIIPRVPPLSDDLLAGYRHISTSTLGHLTETGYLHGIRPLLPDVQMVGNVVTVKLCPPDGGVLREALLLSQPGDVLVVDASDEEARACWGELRALAARVKGLAVYWLAWQAGVSPQRLVLTGVGVSALLMAATTFMLVFSPLTTTLSAYVWLTGSVYGASWGETRELAGWLLLIAPWLVWLARQVRVQQLDDGLAQGIGVRVQWLRLALLLLSVALAGAAIAWG